MNNVFQQDPETQFQQLEMDEEEARDRVKLYQSIMRLKDNPDFQKVFTDGLFREDAARTVGMLTHPSTLQNSTQLKMLENRCIAISEIQQYLRYNIQMGRTAELSLAEYGDTRQELVEEDLYE
jgi:hypothetical protein